MLSILVCQVGKCARQTHGFPAMACLGFTNHASRLSKVNSTFLKPFQEVDFSAVCAATSVVLTNKMASQTKHEYLFIMPIKEGNGADLPVISGGLV